MTKKDIKFRLWGRVFILPFWVKGLVLAAVALAATVTGFLIQKGRDEARTVLLTSPVPAETEAVISPTPSPDIWIYVVGEVNSPGVYRLQSGAMVTEAIEAAGGFTSEGDREAINLVLVLHENTMIKVPAKGKSDGNEGGDWLVVGNGTGDSPQSTGKININTADLEELCTLSGIGESTAKKIISYREANGPFETIEDLMEVPGIKEAKFTAIKEDVCVE